MSALAEGELVAGRYRIEAPIGSGGMGVVYRAVQLPMERVVALKVMRLDLLDETRSRARFEREARVASALTHPSAVIVHDFGEHEGRAFLAMELVEGPSLRQVLQACPRGLPIERAIELTFQLADVLAAAHELSLVHRDLKPENVIVENFDVHKASVGGGDGRDRGPGAPRVRVLDFGLAFRARAGAAAGRMTREGVVMGTPEYLSPEQARGEELGPPTDVYALGCVLHELLAGRPPYAGSEMEVLTKQMYAPAPVLQSDSAVPAALDGLRRAMMDKRPDRRPTAREVGAQLAALDPDPDRERVRARYEGYLGARASRMVDAATDERAAEMPPLLEVAVVGAVAPELLLGLLANGIAGFVVTDEQPIGDAAAVYAPGANLERVAALASGHHVVTDAPRGDMTRLSALMRAGAADVVLAPVSVAELARKLTRVTRGRR